jgi:hypothetical protein
MTLGVKTNDRGQRLDEMMRDLELTLTGWGQGNGDVDTYVVHDTRTTIASLPKFPKALSL